MKKLLRSRSIGSSFGEFRRSRPPTATEISNRDFIVSFPRQLCSSQRARRNGTWRILGAERRCRRDRDSRAHGYGRDIETAFNAIRAHARSRKAPKNNRRQISGAFIRFHGNFRAICRRAFARDFPSGVDPRFFFFSPISCRFNRIVLSFLSLSFSRQIMRSFSLSFCPPLCLFDSERIQARDTGDISPTCCSIFFSNFRRSVFCRSLATDWIYSESFGIPFFVARFIDASSAAALVSYMRV